MDDERTSTKVIEKAQALLRRLAARYPEKSEEQLEKQVDKVAEMEILRARCDYLIRSARVMFGEEAHCLSSNYCDDIPSQLYNAKGELVAYCWVGSTGHAEFKPWSDKNAN